MRTEKNMLCRLIVLVTVFYSSLSFGKESHHSRTEDPCQSEWNAGVGFDTALTLEVGVGPELMCVSSSRKWAWRVGVDVVVELLPQPTGGAELFLSTERKLTERLWVGTAFVATYFASTKFEVGGGLLARLDRPFKNLANVPSAALLVGILGHPHLASHEKSERDELPYHVRMMVTINFH